MASNPRSNAIAQLLLTRVAAIEAVVFAIFLGLAVNIASTLLTERFKDSPSLLIGVAVFLFVASLIWLAIKVAAEVSKEDRWEAVLGIEPGSNQLIDLLVYPFSRDVFRLIQATFIKNKQLLQAWKSCEIVRVSPSLILGRGYGSIAQTRTPSNNPRACVVAKVVEDAVETLVLEIISDSLLDYCSRYKQASWSMVSIEEIRSAMSGNATFEAITAAGAAAGGNSTAIYTIGHNGAMYWAPEMALPPGAKISRTVAGAIRLSTGRMSIEFQVEFPGLNHFETPEFERLYLKRQAGQTELFKVVINTKLTVSAKQLFDFTVWWERDWMDFLIDRLRTRIDFEDFKKRVNFEAALVQRKVQQE